MKPWNMFSKEKVEKVDPKAEEQQVKDLVAEVTQKTEVAIQ